MNRNDVESLVEATDAGREGENIFRLVYEKAGCRKPFRRLWLSSMEDSAILEGFRNFLEVAEKQQLEQLVMQDPQYFYRILPYTYVLGVSDKWIKKFEAINLQAPDWYYGSYYNVYDFGETMDRTMSTANRAMTSSPSESSGGGGSSGGGFSGGGSGGGGGGSW